MNTLVILALKNTKGPNQRFEPLSSNERWIGVSALKCALCPTILAHRTTGQKADGRSIATDFSLCLRAQLARIELIRHLVFSSFLPASPHRETVLFIVGLHVGRRSVNLNQQLAKRAMQKWVGLCDFVSRTLGHDDLSGFARQSDAHEIGTADF